MSNIETWLQNTFHYKIKSEHWFNLALTHRSFSQDHNERLEYLGDAVLDLIIGDALFEQFTQLNEGKLSRYRAWLVKGENLAQLAKSLGVPEYLKLGTGEAQSGGAQRHSILAGAFEALIGAIYKDADYPTVEGIVLGLFEHQLKKIEQLADEKDPKTGLQEYLQSKGLPLPKYQLDEVHGKQHKQSFSMSLTIDLLGLRVSASGASKKKTEQQLAEKMLQEIQQLNA